MGFPLTTKFKAPEDTHTVLVVAPFYWGKGATKAEAMANCKKEGGKPYQQGYIAYYFGPGIKPNPWVDQMGGVNWEYTPEAIEAGDRPYPVKEGVL